LDSPSLGQILLTVDHTSAILTAAHPEAPPGTVSAVPRIRACTLVVALVLVSLGCTTPEQAAPVTSSSRTTPGSPDRLSLGTGDGLVPESDWRARTDDFLAFATREPLSPGSVTSLLAHGARAERDAAFRADLSVAKPSDYTAAFDKLKQMQDTGDFNINSYLFLLAEQRDRLDPALVSALEERILAFKYWWTEPTPAGVVDSQYYWTENHQIIFLANEYIAGQMFPDRTFTNNNMTGAQRRAHAEPLIRRWLDLRARFGWSEWLSNVYYMEDLDGLLLLADWAEDPDLATRASMAIDLLLFEIAANSQAGAFGSTHGRSYMKDKMTALDEDNFSLSKLVFDDTTFPYQHNDTAVHMATARRYRPPEALRKVARSDEVSIGRQRSGIPLDPTAPITSNPVAPYGFSYTSPDDLMIWWGMGAMFAWQVVPLSVETINKYHLWETDLFKERAGALQPIVERSSTDQLQQLGLQLAKPINLGLLSEVDVYTWRAPEVMLSTAQSWRPGQSSDQGHIWQATLDPNAQVFTSLPSAPVPDGSDWFTNSGYWSGEGATPRSTQFENVNVSIYSPQFAGQGDGPLPGYQNFTHAYFPQEHFDEVTQRGNWTFGRKGDGYVALWSQRPVRWVGYDGVSHPNRGMTKPFELIADGGPDNVWVTEVGRGADWSQRGGFAGFVEAVAGAPITATRLGPEASAGFDVRYVSPTRGEVTVGWTGPMRVDGREVPLGDYPRYDSPWAKVDWGTKKYLIEADSWFAELDFDRGTRVTGKR